MTRVYNKYIGNTGKFIRVEDHPGVNAYRSGMTAAKTPPPHIPDLQPNPSAMSDGAPAPHRSAKNKSFLGGFGGGLNNLFGSFSGGLGGLMSGFKGMFDRLPFGLDLGDILLLLLLLFFFIESGDEEFIIILVIIAYNIFRER